MSGLMEGEKMRRRRREKRKCLGAAATHLQSASFPDCGHNDAKSTAGIAAEDAVKVEVSEARCDRSPASSSRLAAYYLPGPALHTIPYFPSKRDSFISGSAALAFSQGAITSGPLKLNQQWHCPYFRRVMRFYLFKE